MVDNMMTENEGDAFVKSVMEVEMGEQLCGLINTFAGKNNITPELYVETVIVSYLNQLPPYVITGENIKKDWDKQGSFVTGSSVKEKFKFNIDTAAVLVMEKYAKERTMTINDWVEDHLDATLHGLLDNGQVEKMTKHPYMVEGTDYEPLLPTHTHGLTAVDFPEFIVDHRAFGLQGNGILINHAYEYLSRPQNKIMLEEIKNGKTVKLTEQELWPDNLAERNYVYCLRKVEPTFEAVKMSYPGYLPPCMWFVQIYIEGDDFVLTDDYYLQGMPAKYKTPR